MSDLSVIDRPLSRAEEDGFYGGQTTPWEWIHARRDAERNYDAADICEDAAEHADAICAALAAGDTAEVGRILGAARATTISRRAEYAVTGRIRSVFEEARAAS